MYSSILSRSSLRDMRGVNEPTSIHSASTIIIFMGGDLHHYSHIYLARNYISVWFRARINFRLRCIKSAIYLANFVLLKINEHLVRITCLMKGKPYFRLAFINCVSRCAVFQWDALTPEKLDPLESENPLFQMINFISAVSVWWSFSIIGVVVRSSPDLKIVYSNTHARI